MRIQYSSSVLGIVESKTLFPYGRAGNINDVCYGRSIEQSRNSALSSAIGVRRGAL